MRLTEAMVGQKYRNYEFTTMRQINWIGVGLDDVSVISQMPNMETVAFSKNEIHSLQPFCHCKKLRELHLRDNRITSFDELKFLQELPKLRVLTLNGNPLEQYANYRSRVLSMLPNLKEFDGVPVVKNEPQAAFLFETNERVCFMQNGLIDATEAETGPEPTSQASQADVNREIGGATLTCRHQYQGSSLSCEQSRKFDRRQIIDALEGAFRWATNCDRQQLSREECLIDMVALVVSEMDEQKLGEVRGIIRRRLNY